MQIGTHRYLHYQSPNGTPCLMYDAEFFKSVEGYARTSAEVIAPLLRRLIDFSSAVDVGCGDGAWLSAFADAGVTDYLGVDGDYVDKAHLKIPPAQFQSADLNQKLTLNRRFDLAMSMEVAEHLKPERAETFVADLTALSDVVLFSAAIPGQGGINHINEQWPQYWAEIFDRNGYEVFDCLRPDIWTNPRVGWYYAQNALVFVRRSFLDDSRVKKSNLGEGGKALPLVHPFLYHFKTEDPGIGPVVKGLPKLLNKAVRKRLFNERDTPPDLTG